MKTLVKFAVSGDIAFDGKCYVAICNDLGLVVYGKTKGDADKRMSKAIDIWSDRLNVKGLLVNRLNTWMIPHKIIRIHTMRKGAIKRNWGKELSVAMCS